MGTAHLLLGVGGGFGIGARVSVNATYWVFSHLGLGVDAGAAGYTLPLSSTSGSLYFAAPMLSARYSFRRARLVASAGAGIGTGEARVAGSCDNCSQYESTPSDTATAVGRGTAFYVGGRLGCLFRLRNLELGFVVLGEGAPLPGNAGFAMASLNFVIGAGFGGGS